MKKIVYTNKKGFTLIELMIVVVLIAILSGILLNVINVRGLRAKSRDGQRASELAKLGTALEIYFADNRSYPLANTWQLVNAAGGVGKTLKDGNYSNAIPTDPSAPSPNTSTNPCASTDIGYFYIANAGSFILATNMEIASSVTKPCTGLNNWNTTRFPGICTPAGNCHGVENQF